MKVLVDAHHVGSRATGNETWAHQVTEALVALFQSNVNDQLIVALRRGVVDCPADVATHPVSGHQVLRLARDLPRLAAKLKADVMLVQYTASLARMPHVVAIHDLSFTRPESRSWIPTVERRRMAATIRWSASRAAKIVALSKFTANELHTKWGIEEHKVVVAYPGLSSRFRAILAGQSRTDDWDGSGPVIVTAVGNVVPRKNLLALAYAVDKLRREGLPAELRLVGQVPVAARSLASRLRSLGGSWLTITGYVDEVELVREYQRSHVFCFPSYHEGFGIPVLEAMAAGTPAVVSTATALPEAAGGAALMVDPLDREGWADAIRTIVCDRALAALLRSAGRQNASLFTWDTTAKGVLAAIREAAS